MEADPGLTNDTVPLRRGDDLAAIAAEVARAMTFSRVRGRSAYVGTGVSYPNGTAVVVRIDESPNGYLVTDDGQGSFVAETMGGAAQYSKAAVQAVRRSGLNFDRRSIFVEGIGREQLPGAASAIANASARAVERTVYMLDRFRLERSKEMFSERLRSAFGRKVKFGVSVHGSTGRPYEFDAAVEEANGLRRALFEFVSPTFNAVAAANLKIGDTRALLDAPPIVVALADYDRTDESLRSILSVTATSVIPANDLPERYRLVAAA